MADRRMFAKTITDSDAFLDLPPESQRLYFHLSMRADDDGFINNPKRIMRATGAADEALSELISRRFILSFPSGVIVIKHWRINNYLRNDRYKPTVYQREFALLSIRADGAYTEKDRKKPEEPTPDGSGIPPVDQRYTTGIPSGNQVSPTRYTQVRLGKDRLYNKESQLDELSTTPSVAQTEPDDFPDDDFPDETPSPTPPDPPEEKPVPPVALALATLIKTLHQEVDKKYNPPDRHLRTWAVDIDRLHRLDGRSWPEIEDVIRHAKTPGNFWFPNILSGKSLREQFARLFAEIQRPAKKTTPRIKADAFSGGSW